MTSAISNTALYQHIEDCMGIAREFNHRRCAIRTVLTVLAIILAESVPRFDLVMSMIGGTLTGPIVFVLPPLFYIKMLRMKEEHERLIVINLDSTLPLREEDKRDYGVGFTGRRNIEIVVSMTLVVFGIVSIVATTYVNVLNTMQYATFSRPCIYNLTMYLT